MFKELAILGEVEFCALRYAAHENQDVLIDLAMAVEGNKLSAFVGILENTRRMGVCPSDDLKLAWGSLAKAEQDRLNLPGAPPLRCAHNVKQHLAALAVISAQLPLS